MGGRQAAARALVVVGLAASLALRARADDAVGIDAKASCARADGPGRVRCEVTTVARGGRARWGDVLVLSAPPFAAPLRSRLGPSEATVRGEDEARFALALGATGKGAGTLVVRVRAVVCGASGCRPVVAEATADVVVGAPVDAGAE